MKMTGHLGYPFLGIASTATLHPYMHICGCDIYKTNNQMCSLFQSSMWYILEIEQRKKSVISFF